MHIKIKTAVGVLMISKNLSSLDRFARGGVGIAVTGFALFNGDILQEPLLEILLGTFGVLNLISFITGWCPVYHLAHISTLDNQQ